MSYRVVVEPAALEDIAEAYAWLAERDPDAAFRWLTGLSQVRDPLSEMPRRFLKWDYPGRSGEVCRMIYGRGRNRYRVVYLIEGDTVSILSVRHAARRERR